MELYIFCPGALYMVGSLSDYFLPMLRVGTSELGDAPIQHDDMMVCQRNFLARYELCF